MPTASPAAMRAGITPDELALMREAAARVNPAILAGGTDPFAALTLSFVPAPADPEGDWCVKPKGGWHYYL